MFGLFKKRSTSAMDELIKAIYGDKPPHKSADVDQAVRLAADDLLCGTTDRDCLVRLAKELDASPVPYSTHDLAVSVALRIFKDADAVAREELFTAQLTARLAALEWAKEGKVARALLGAFEQTLYKLYTPGVNDQRQQEVLLADSLGEQFAKALAPTTATMLAAVQEWHPSAGPKAFVAVASLRVAGFRIGANQQSIVEKVDTDALAEVHHSLIGELIDKSMPHDDPAFKPYERMSEIMTLAGALTDVFYANASSKPPKPVPHWFVGKEVCAFLQRPDEVPNPEEIMTFADFLSASMRVTKKSLDDLLDAGIRIVPGAHEVSTGVASSRDDPTSIDVHVPPLPKSFGDATLVAWHKKPGDMVRRDENIADLETDEVVVEVTAPANGVMGEQKVATGITVTGGQVIAVISRF